MHLTALMMAMTATPSQQGQELSETWKAEAKQGACTVIETFTNQLSQRSGALGITYNYRLNRVHLMFLDASVKSLKDKDKRKIKVNFITADGVDDSWGEEHEWSVAMSEKGAFFGAYYHEDILDDIAAAKGIAFLYRDILLQAYPLNGSAKGIARLRACAETEAQINPTDPFEREQPRP